ncbi:MAG: hypothetical protein CVV02_07025 [Firmicutes bacterium HGW-Firmicutes-7]|nr:MAG: hypothetical protein CVV02_07025 [Firmicutes bacterium HGW-Firmicutes-7]
MRKKLIAGLMVAVFIGILSSPVVPIGSASFLHDYYIQNFTKDTGALNSVTSIYLNYRIFDTLFETLLLLISVIGIIYFSRHEGDY